MFAIEVIAAQLREVVAGLDPDTFAGRDAARLTEVAAEIERLGAAAKALFARRAVDANGWQHGSRAVTGEKWLADVSGTSEGQARDALQTVQRLHELPTTAEKVRDGSLSMTQAALVSKAAAVNPDAEDRLLRTAEREGLRTLRDRADRVIAAATDDKAAHARAHAERHFRTWRQGMATHGSFSGSTEQVDVLLRALEPLEKARFEQARKDPDTPRETYQARMFDALVDLAEGARRESGPPVTRIRVDLGRLLDHDPDAPGEVCEIPGVGPVPVSHARWVLPHGLLELVISDGVDVQTVVSRTRHVPEALKVAVAERDERCKIRGCDTTHGLERHHLERFAEHRLTTYDLLGRVCGDHHDQITYRGHEVIVEDDGTWTLRPPDERRQPDAA